jgi:hypothetical protein
LTDKSLRRPGPERNLLSPPLRQIRRTQNRLHSIARGELIPAPHRQRHIGRCAGARQPRGRGRDGGRRRGRDGGGVGTQSPLAR